MVRSTAGRASAAAAAVAVAAARCRGSSSWALSENDGPAAASRRTLAPPGAGDGSSAPRGEVLPRQRGEVDGADDVAVEPRGELGGLRFERAARRQPGPAPRETTSTRPSSRWHQTPTIRPSHHAVGPPLPLRSKTLSLCSPRWNARSFQPIVRRVERGQERDPRARDRRGASRSSGSTQPVAPPSSETSTAATSARARRTAAFVAPSHQTRSASVPGPNGAEPGRHQRGVPLVLGQRRGRLSQPVGRRRPAGARDLPAAVVLTPHDGARRPRARRSRRRRSRPRPGRRPCRG